MTLSHLWKIPVSILLLALLLPGCAGMTQEIREDRRDVWRTMEQGESSYEKREYFGLPAKQEDWNATDWSLWMDSHGGGR
jgi:hypothetical protein